MARLYMPAVTFRAVFFFLPPKNSMKIHIIQPTHFTGQFSRKLYKSGRRALVPLTLPYLASLVPDDIDITLTDEQTQELDFTQDYDCVLITSTILTSFRVYDIAAKYRQRGIPVIIGGPHCTFYGDEALQHADAIAVGEGEETVPRIIADVAAGRLRKRYRAQGHHDIKGLPFPRYDLLDPSTISRIPTYAVQTTRGCPYRCSFCAERFHLGERYRMRPVEEVVEEIRATGCRQIFFADSTFAGKRSIKPSSLIWEPCLNQHGEFSCVFCYLSDTIQFSKIGSFLLSESYPSVSVR